MNVLIIGASRGIGLEFVRQYLAEGDRVTATARSAESLDALRLIGAEVLELDVSSLSSTTALAAQIAGQAFDIAVVCAGIFGPRTCGQQVPAEIDFNAVMHTNVLGPMRVLPQIGEALAFDARLAVISSRMGAIGPRVANNGGLYRASKAALNSVLKDTSLTLAGRATCVSIHPGWVRTEMGGAGAELDVGESVADMRRLIVGLTPADNGRFLNHDGSAIAW